MTSRTKLEPSAEPATSRFRPWKVLHVSLEETVPSLEHDASIGGYWAVIWWKGLPLGHLTIPSSQLPVTSGLLAALAARAIAPAVGKHLFAQGFEAALPVPPRKRKTSPLGPLAAALELQEPLFALSERANAELLSGSGVSVAVCTHE